MWLLKNLAFVYLMSLLFGLAVLYVSLKVTQPKPTERTTLTLAQLEDAIIAVESGGNPKAFNAHENACGAMQIRPIYVDDANRILGRQEFTLADRWNVDRSRNMFRVVTGHYLGKYPQMDEFEARARIHNGGAKGPLKKSTKKYWRRTQKHLHSN